MSLKQFSVLFPPATSFVALAMIFGAAATTGIARDADEGTLAHLFQLLMAAQIPVMAYFAIRWLPRNPRPALLILAVQVAAVAAALSPVYFWRL